MGHPHGRQPLSRHRVDHRAGVVDDPEGLSGLAAFTTGLLDTGTTTRTAQEIAETIDTTGAVDVVGFVPCDMIVDVLGLKPVWSRKMPFARLGVAAGTSIPTPAITATYFQHKQKMGMYQFMHNWIWSPF